MQTEALPRSLFRPVWLWLGALCLLALFLRHHQLLFRGLWVDEVYAAIGADPAKSWGEFIEYFRTDPAHPLHLFLLRIWVRIFEWNDYWMRLFSVLAGVAAIPGLYYLGRAVRDDHCGGIAAILGAVNYYLIYYSQEVRPYALMVATATFSTLFYLRYLGTLRRGALIGYAVSTVLMLASQAFAAFVLAAQFAYAVGLLLKAERALRRRLAAVAVGLGALFGAVGLGLAAWLMPLRLKTGGAHIATAPESDYVWNYLLQFFGNDRVLALAIAAFALAAVVLHFRPGAAAPARGPLPVRPLSLIVLTVLFLTIVPYVLSIAVQPILFPRWYIYLVPFVIIIAAYGIAALLERTAGMVVTTCLAVLSVVSLVHWNKFYSKQFADQPREIVAFMLAKSPAPEPGVDIFYFTNVAIGVKYYGARAGKKWDWHLGHDLARLQALRQGAKPVGVWVVSSIWPVAPQYQQELDAHFNKMHSATFNWNGSAAYYTFRPAPR